MRLVQQTIRGNLRASLTDTMWWVRAWEPTIPGYAQVVCTIWKEVESAVLQRARPVLLRKHGVRHSIKELEL